MTEPGLHCLRQAQRLAIIGTGGHATSCIDVATSAGYEGFVFVDPRRAGGRVLGFPVVSCVQEALDAGGYYEVFIAIGDNFRRSLVAAETRRAFAGARFPAFIHRAACVSPLPTAQ